MAAKTGRDAEAKQAVFSLTRRSARTYIGEVKRRNQLLALFCLLAFAALGVLYFRVWVVQKPFGIILFIGEGLTPGRLAPARAFASGSDGHLAIDQFDSTALLVNHSNDFAAPDQAAAASALATGAKVNNGSIALTPNGKSLDSLIDLARASGRATGLVTDGSLTSVVPAAFYTHGPARTERSDIALALANEGKLDIAFGGGAADFLPRAKRGRREDGRDLLLELRRNGFDIVQTKAELEALPRWRRPKVFGVFGENGLSYAGQVAVGTERPSLADMVRRAVELLQFNPNGYLLVVDASLMGQAARENNGERTLGETIELDRALAVARIYAGRKATVVVAGDCGIGGLSLNGFPFRKDSGVALLGLNSSGSPWLTWATGPRGPRRSPGETIPPSQAQMQEPAAVFLPDASVTVEDVFAAGSGLGTDQIRGVMDNTKVFEIIRDNL